mgnify:CR=1 FL=1
MKTKRISVTIPEDLLKESEELAEERLEDRSTVIRQLIAEGLKEEKKKKAVDMYMDKKVSLEKAAEIADVSVWKMLDLLRDRNVPLRYDRREAEKEIEDILGSG